MFMIKKLILITTLLFLLSGMVYASGIDDLKTLNDYKDFDANGCSNSSVKHDKYFLVEKVSELDDDFKNEWFSSHPEYDFTAESVGDNIYFLEDNTFKFYGYEEIVELDDGYYKVNLYQDSKLSPGEKTNYLDELKEFNKVNKLEPVSVE